MVGCEQLEACKVLYAKVSSTAWQHPFGSTIEEQAGVAEIHRDVNRWTGTDLNLACGLNESTEIHDYLPGSPAGREGVWR
jgi:hypothetical protein